MRLLDFALQQLWNVTNPGREQNIPTEQPTLYTEHWAFSNARPGAW
jgi:hypothetical protein